MKRLDLVLVSCLFISLIGVTEASAKSIGPQPITPTAISKGTLFVSPTGSGTTCSQLSPCSIWSATSKAVGGSVVFLRGGTYRVSQSIRFLNNGTAAAPIIFESYPGETAIFDGSQHPKGTDIGIYVNGKFIQIRSIEIKNMPMQGIFIQGTDNILDGIHAHHNGLTGIHVWSPYDAYPYGAYGSRNIIRNSIVHDNSGAGLGGEFANGGNSDGIAISSGADNRIENCLAYANSDDGIDVWRSTNSYVGYSIAHSNGIAGGDGNGIKAGGDYPSTDTTIEHNLSHSNKVIGITYNDGRNAKFVNNTTWNNSLGYALGSDTVVTDNIAAEVNVQYGTGIATDNSWQRSGKVSFVSTDPNSPYFLVPTNSGGFEDIGAHANTTVGNTSLLSDLVVSDISYANGIFTAKVKNQGLAAIPAGFLAY